MLQTLALVSGRIDADTESVARARKQGGGGGGGGEVRVIDNSLDAHAVCYFRSRRMWHQ